MATLTCVVIDLLKLIDVYRSSFFEVGLRLHLGAATFDAMLADRFHRVTYAKWLCCKDVNLLLMTRFVVKIVKRL